MADDYSKKMQELRRAAMAEQADHVESMNKKSDIKAKNAKNLERETLDKGTREEAGMANFVKGQGPELKAKGLLAGQKK